MTFGVMVHLGLTVHQISLSHLWEYSNSPCWFWSLYVFFLFYTLFIITAKSFDASSPLLYITTEIAPAEDRISSGDFKCQSSIRWKGQRLRCWCGVPVFQWCHSVKPESYSDLPDCTTCMATCLLSAGCTLCILGKSKLMNLEPQKEVKRTLPVHW